jgi:protein ImuB
MSEPALYACVYSPPHALAAAVSSASPSPLVAIAAEFSPRYEQHGVDLVSIDVRGLARLFGTPRALGAELRREAASRGVLVHVAVAPSRTAALVLSLARPGLTVVPANGVASALADVPLTVLEQLHDEQPASSLTQARLRAEDAREAMAALTRWGLRTVGELAALPAADLSARLGSSGRLWQALARGEDTRPLVPMLAEERFDATLELEWPIEGLEPLSFVLTRLLEPLSTRLERRDRGAAVLYVELGLVTREVHVCRLELPSPLREVRALRTLALLDAEAHPPSAAIDKVTVTIEPTPGRILQHTLFTRPHPTPEQLSTLLARLAALMGQDRVGAPALVDSYRPGAFTMTPFAIEHSSGAQASGSGVRGPGSGITDLRADATVQNPDLQPLASSLTNPESAPLLSALRRCRQPIPARVTADRDQRPLRVLTDRRGFAGGAVVSCAGPWRTSGAWWEAEEQREGGLGAPKRSLNTQREGGWNRDEWDVALADGAVYRIFRDRVSDGWFIDGVMD